MTLQKALSDLAIAKSYRASLHMVLRTQTFLFYLNYPPALDRLPREREKVENKRCRVLDTTLIQSNVAEAQIVPLIS